MAERIVVIVPAYNEAKRIGALLDSITEIQKAGKVHEIIVVDDCSTDKTGKIARKKGAYVIRLEKNSGKAFAFYKGVERARDVRATIVVTLDADLKPVSKKQIEKLLNPVTKGKFNMSIGTVRDTLIGSDVLIEFSGQRAIKVKALEPLFRQDRRWEMSFGIRNSRARYRMGYELEMALNHLIKRKQDVHTGFETQLKGGRWLPRDWEIWGKRFVRIKSVMDKFKGRLPQRKQRRRK